MSLRTRLLVVALAIIVTYAATAFLIVQAQRSLLVEQVDTQLASLPPVFAPSGARQQPVGVSGAQPPVADESNENTFSDIFIGTVSSDGQTTTLFAGELLTGSPDLLLAVESADGAATTLTIDSLDSDERFRARIVPQEDGSTWLVSAKPLDDVDSAIEGLSQILIIGGAILLAVLAVAMFWIQRLGLRPIGEITTTAEAIIAGDRSMRVEIAAPGTEAAKLATSFNVMLDERDAADERLRQFVADASHELRTPLTAIRGYLALYHQGGFADEPALSDAMRRLSAESSRMSLLVAELLSLASLDEGRPLVIEPVVIDQLLRDAALDAQAIQPAREIDVSVPGEPIQVVGDRALLTQLIGILVANALAHTPVTAAIRLSAWGDREDVVVVVADEGGGLDPEAAAHVFDRFWRKEAGRSRSNIPGVGGGSGLGLAIGRSIAEAHHGTIGIESTLGHGTTFTVRLPAKT